MSFAIKMITNERKSNAMKLFSANSYSISKESDHQFLPFHSKSINYFVSNVLGIQSSRCKYDLTSVIFFASWQLAFGCFNAPKFERFCWHRILSLVYRPIPFGSKSSLPLFSLNERRTLALSFLLLRKKILTKKVSKLSNGIGLFQKSKIGRNFYQKIPKKWKRSCSWKI